MPLRLSLNGEVSEEWAWRNAEGKVEVSLGLPELLEEVDSVDALHVREEYRWMHMTNHTLGDLNIKPEDVGGVTCPCFNKLRHNQADTVMDDNVGGISAVMRQSVDNGPRSFPRSFFSSSRSSASHTSPVTVLIRTVTKSL